MISFSCHLRIRHKTTIMVTLQWNFQMMVTRWSEGGFIVKSHCCSSQRKSHGDFSVDWPKESKMRCASRSLRGARLPCLLADPKFWGPLNEFNRSETRKLYDRGSRLHLRTIPNFPRIWQHRLLRFSVEPIILGHHHITLSERARVAHHLSGTRYLDRSRAVGLRQVPLTRSCCINAFGHRKHIEERLVRRIWRRNRFM